MVKLVYPRRDPVGGVRDSYMTAMANRVNSVMKGADRRWWAVTAAIAAGLPIVCREMRGRLTASASVHVMPSATLARGRPR